MLFTTATTANEFYERLARVSVPIAKFARIPLSLAQWFQHSTLRIVALEIRNFPLRIAAVINTPYLRMGNTLFSASRDRSMGNFVQESKYQRVCSASIQALRDNHPWAGPLDLEIAAQMHRQGALWAFDNPGHLSCPDKKIQNTDQV
jgi:hypothetical protein